MSAKICLLDIFQKKIFFVSLISPTISLLTMFWRCLEINFLIYGTTHRVLWLGQCEIGVTGRQGRELAFEVNKKIEKKKFSSRGIRTSSPLTTSPPPYPFLHPAKLIITCYTTCFEYFPLIEYWPSCTNKTAWSAPLLCNTFYITKNSKFCMMTKKQAGWKVDCN